MPGFLAGAEREETLEDGHLERPGEERRGDSESEKKDCPETDDRKPDNDRKSAKGEGGSGRKWEEGGKAESSMFNGQWSMVTLIYSAR